MVEKTKEPRVMTVAEAAAELRCSTAHIRNMVRRGEIKAFQSQRLIRIPTDVVTEMCEGTLRRQDVPAK